MAAKHWSETPEKTNTAGISFLLAVFRLGGRTLFHLSLWPVIVFYWLVSPTARRASRLYLDHVARTKNEPRPGCLATLKHIWRFADTILDKLLAVSGFLLPKTSLLKASLNSSLTPEGQSSSLRTPAVRSSVNSSAKPNWKKAKPLKIG